MSRAERFQKMFASDTARIVHYGQKQFLIIGFRKNTKCEFGQWYRNGKRVNFTYVQEKVIASGSSDAGLLRSARKYQRLSKIKPFAEMSPTEFVATLQEIL